MSRSEVVCKYYAQGYCARGKDCFFLHDQTDAAIPSICATEASNGEPSRLTASKELCKYFAQGYCRRGNGCWFRHENPEVGGALPGATSGGANAEASTSSITRSSGDHTCAICLEVPVTFGLLPECDHIFCLTCIREWRKKTDVGSQCKSCPLCRTVSNFIIPSSVYATGAQKNKICGAYRAKTARIPCKHFRASPANNRFCPFGNSCHFAHLNPDGTRHVLDEEQCHVQQRRRRPQYQRNSGQEPAGWSSREFWFFEQENLDEFEDGIGEEWLDVDDFELYQEFLDEFGLCVDNGLIVYGGWRRNESSDHSGIHHSRSSRDNEAEDEEDVDEVARSVAHRERNLERDSQRRRQGSGRGGSGRRARRQQNRDRDNSNNSHAYLRLQNLQDEADATVRLFEALMVEESRYS
ncbi:uncharacterized protein VTP21DRAFT_486 [Calcarisporiella thermophila]|uniref:uncharacterized protein n=1 Tax=Calcarisporiella thermophila TaxID=911321 RepID=UPI0037436731